MHMANLVKRVTTSGTERDTRDSAQRVAGEMFEHGFVILKTGQPFQDPDHSDFWSIDLEYAKAEDVTDKTEVVVPAPSQPEAEVEATPPGTVPSGDAR